MAGALCLLQRLDLVFKMLVLPLQVLNVTAVTAVLPPHKGDILACLFEDLSPAALVPLPGLQAGDGVLQPGEAVLDVVSPLSLLQIRVENEISTPKFLLC